MNTAAILGRLTEHGVRVVRNAILLRPFCRVRSRPICGYGELNRSGLNKCQTWAPTASARLAIVPMSVNDFSPRRAAIMAGCAAKH